MIEFIQKIFGKNQPDFKGLVQNGATIIDVRTPGEYRSGHIKGSLNIPLDGIRNRIGELKKKNKPVIAVCRSGARSGAARSMLAAAGLEAYNGGPWFVLQKKIQ